VEQSAAAVLRGNPGIDVLMVIPRRHGLGRVRDDLSLAFRLRRQRFDIAIDLHGGPRSAWLTWASRAPTRIGYSIPGRSWMYTHAVRREDDLTPRHSVLNQWDLLGPLGIGPADPARDPVEMADDPEAAAAVDQRLRQLAIGPANPVVVIHVSAGNAFRRWPETSFCELVVALARSDASRRIILTSGPSDSDAAERIRAAARERLGSDEAVPSTGEWELTELRALVARASVYIGGDSGPVHVAATTETPIVELLGPTLPERSRPWRDPRWFAETVDMGPLPCRPCHQRHCVPGDFRCLVGISVARVAEAAERAMSTPSGADA
jgi:ADP-heptose:LPS heptosyltransferase